MSRSMVPPTCCGSGRSWVSRESSLTGGNRQIHGLKAGAHAQRNRSRAMRAVNWKWRIYGRDFLRRRLRTTNLIERVFVEVRRRTRPMVCFVDVDSVDRIIYSIFHRFNLEWRNRTLRIFTQAA